MAVAHGIDRRRVERLTERELDRFVYLEIWSDLAQELAR